MLILLSTLIEMAKTYLHTCYYILNLKNGRDKAKFILVPQWFNSYEKTEHGWFVLNALNQIF